MEVKEVRIVDNHYEVLLTPNFIERLFGYRDTVRKYYKDGFSFILGDLYCDYEGNLISPTLNCDTFENALLDFIQRNDRGIDEEISKLKLKQKELEKNLTNCVFNPDTSIIEGQIKALEWVLNR